MLITEAELKAAKAAIKEDIRAGIVPETVRSFSVLHDYVDANEYLADVWSIDDVDRANALSDALDAWLKQIPDTCPHSAMQNMGGACDACTTKAWA